jgi:hypothetical protein
MPGGCRALEGDDEPEAFPNSASAICKGTTIVVLVMASLDWWKLAEMVEPVDSGAEPEVEEIAIAAVCSRGGASPWVRRLKPKAIGHVLAPAAGKAKHHHEHTGTAVPR